MLCGVILLSGVIYCVTSVRPCLSLVPVMLQVILICMRWIDKFIFFKAVLGW